MNTQKTLIQAIRAGDLVAADAFCDQLAEEGQDALSRYLRNQFKNEDRNSLSRRAGRAFLREYRRHLAAVALHARLDAEPLPTETPITLASGRFLSGILRADEIRWVLAWQRLRGIGVTSNVIARRVLVSVPLRRDYSLEVNCPVSAANNNACKAIDELLSRMFLHDTNWCVRGD